MKRTTPRISLLAQSDMEQIHEQALDILTEIGIQFNSARAIAILADAGCVVDYEEQSAKILSDLVEKALEKITEAFERLLHPVDEEKIVIGYEQ